MRQKKKKNYAVNFRLELPSYGIAVCGHMQCAVRTSNLSVLNFSNINPPMVFFFSFLFSFLAGSLSQTSYFFLLNKTMLPELQFSFAKDLASVLKKKKEL